MGERWRADIRGKPSSPPCVTPKLRVSEPCRWHGVTRKAGAGRGGRIGSETT